MILNLSNGLSFLRAPLALLFLSENSWARVIAVGLAMLTDSVDGYLARRQHSTSQFGAILDPAMDKFFVFFALGVLLMEGRLHSGQASCLLARDACLLLFAIYLKCSGKWSSFICRAIHTGKITTALQFVVLVGIVLGAHFPPILFALFILLGLLSFLELLLLARKPDVTP